MRLSHWLEANHITVAEFTRRIGGVSHEAVRLWATGKRMPDTRNCIRIEELTDGAVTIHDLHQAHTENHSEGAA